jgi:hypothetical protein
MQQADYVGEIETRTAWRRNKPPSDSVVFEITALYDG